FSRMLDKYEYEEEFDKSIDTINRGKINEPFLKKWYPDEGAIVCEGYLKIYQDDVLYLMVDGTKVFRSKMLDENGEIQPRYADHMQYVKAYKNVKSCQVLHFNMDGEEILDHRILPVENIPVAFVAGKEIDRKSTRLNSSHVKI